MKTILQYLTNIFKFILPLILVLSLSSQYLYGLNSDFSFQLNDNCAPTVVIFTNESVNAQNIEYIWNFGKGALVFSQEEVLTEAYSEPGSYEVTLSAIEGSDTVRISKTVVIATKPQASFTTDINQGCIPLDVTFTSTSSEGSSPIQTVFWDFREGTTGNGNIYTYTYEQDGTFDVFMSIIDENGCKDYVEAFGFIHAYALPVVSFNASDSFACDPPLLVNFTNNSEGNGTLSSQWDFGNNTSSENYFGSTVYTDTGSFDVTLSITDVNGCTNSYTKEGLINIGRNTGDIFLISSGHIVSENNAIVCPGSILIGSSLPEQTELTWTIDYNGSSDTYEDISLLNFSATDSGRIDIKLVYGLNTDCPDSIFKSFRVDLIKADFSIIPEKICQLPADIELTNNSDNAIAYEWLLPDETSSSETDLIYTIPSQNTHGNIYNSNLNEYSIPFILFAENENGCTDSIKNDYEIILPVAQFTPDKPRGCVPLEVTFTENSKSEDPIVEWTYIIDGQEFTQADNSPFNYTFNSPGEFPVQLIIKNDQNCVDTSYTIIIEVGEIIYPYFSVTPAELCNGDLLQLNDESPNQELIDTWQYSSLAGFNTGTVETPNNIVRINADTPGSKDVLLTVNYNGCLSDTLLTDIYTVKGPTGYFDYSFDCNSPYEYTFLAEILNADELIWYIDDTTFTNIDSLVFNFESTGTYEVILEATNVSDGCTLVRRKFINVREVHADFSINPYICLNELVEFNASSSANYIDNCYIEGFLWDFGDGSTPRRNWDTIQEHIFSVPGVFYPRLIVFDDNGCSDTLIKQVEVIQPPVSFSVSPTTGCGPDLTVDFAFDTVDPTIDNWYWIFGDATFDYTQNMYPEHIYSGSTLGDWTYSAALVVTDIYGCMNVDFEEITVYSSSIDFLAEETGLCLGEAATFHITQPDVTNILWHFGDGDSSLTENSHVYSETGLFDIQFTAERNGCILTKTKTNYISVQEADAAFIMSDTVFECYPATVTFNHLDTSGNIVEGIWTFAPSAQSHEYSAQVEYTYSEPGIYEPSLYIRTANNCIASSTAIIEVTGPEVEFAFEPAFICRGDSVSFEIIDSDDIDEFQWVFGDGNTSYEANPTHAYFAQGQLYPGIWVRDGECEVTIIDEPLYVSQINAAFSLMPIKDNYCYLDSLFALNQSIDYSTSAWSVNGSPVSSNRDLSGLIFESLGEIVIGLQISNGIGCRDTLVQTYNVVDLPDFNIAGESSFCSNENTTLTVTGGLSLSVEWFPPEYFDTPTSLTTVASPDTTMYITAIVSDNNQCSSSQSILLTVIEPPDLSWSPNDTSIIIGDTVQLIVSSDFENSTYSWSPTYQISCTSCNNPLVRPFENTTYVAEVTDECGTSSVEIYVEVISNHYLEFPSAFSPNGDNENDIFIFESENIKEVDFRIFNRWGNLVFSSTSLTEGWDGHYEGKQQNTDTYSYHIIATTEYGYVFEKKGTFLLIR